MCPKYTDAPPHYHFLCSKDRENVNKIFNLSLKLERSYHREQLCTEFQIDWTSNFIKYDLDQTL